MAHDWTSFTLKIGVKASLADIYAAWARAGKIEQWFLRTSRFIDDKGHNIGPDTNAEAGNTYEWTWYLYDEVETGKVTKANGVDALQFTFAGDCLVDILLREVEGYVMVQLTQHNIPTDEPSRFSIRIGCVQGWTFYLTNLKSVYENGTDLRNRIPALKGVNN